MTQFLFNLLLFGSILYLVIGLGTTLYLLRDIFYDNDLDWTSASWGVKLFDFTVMVLWAPVALVRQFISDIFRRDWL